MKHFWALPAFLRVAIASKHAFSVHDDLLAFPQYEVDFSPAFVSEDEAASRLAYAASRAARAASEESQGHGELAHAGSHSPPLLAHSDQSEPIDAYDYEAMLFGGRRYLCNIPIVKPVDKNDTAATAAATTSPDEEKKELMRATGRGWELLKEMQDQCIYYLSGWWSYSFCYGSEIRQFHQLPPSKGVPLYPPVEDPNVQSYVLGTYAPQEDVSRERSGQAGRESEVAKLETRGEMRYLVQKLTGGTVCDLTGRERKIEVQFHCHPQSADRIGMIKEVSTCSYLMVIYTPRLCNDVAFLPPQEDRPNMISCQEIVAEADFPAREAERARADEQINMQEFVQEWAVVGGVEVGAKKDVGSEGKVIEKSVVVGGGKETFIATLASSEGSMSEKELRKLNIRNVKDVEKAARDLRKAAKGNGWKLNLVDTPRGREMRGIIETVKQDDNAKADEEERDQGEEGGGSEESYKDEL